MLLSIQEIALRINTQNHRSTQNPIFVIQEKKEIVTHTDFSDHSNFYNGEGDIMSEEELCEDCQMACDYNDGSTGGDPCPGCGYQSTYPVKEEWVFNLNHGVFLTSRECDMYIQQNKHHFENETRSFAISTKSVELISVFNFISSHSESGEPNNHYK